MKNWPQLMPCITILSYVALKKDMKDRKLTIMSTLTQLLFSTILLFCMCLYCMYCNQEALKCSWLQLPTCLVHLLHTSPCFWGIETVTEQKRKHKFCYGQHDCCGHQTVQDQHQHILSCTFRIHKPFSRAIT